MYELIQLSEQSYYIQCPAKIGVIKTGDEEVCLIDSGNDKDAGKKVRRILEERGWKLKAIYNTHSHADHIGGNKYLAGQTGCSIYAPAIESAIASHTILEPMFLYGANPPKALRHKFLMAQECPAQPLSEEVLPEGWEIIPLPGHSFDMAGYRIPDGTVFLADCLSGPEALEKHPIGFLVDVGKYYETLQLVQTLEAKYFVPSHDDVTEEIAPIARLNIEKVYEISDKILEICREPVCFEQLLKKLFDIYELELSFEQYALVGSTVRSYLTWLSDNGRIKDIIDRNLLLWKAE